MKRIAKAALQAYSIPTFTLIPLHRPDDKSTKHGRQRKDGKRPLDKNWQTNPYAASQNSAKSNIISRDIFSN